MRRAIAIVAAAVAALLASPGSGAEKRIAAQEVKGCVAAGVEAGCLVLRDVDQGTFTLVFPSGAKDRPKPGMAIAAKGTPSNALGICMQGKAFEVKEWREIQLPCAGGEKE